MSKKLIDGKVSVRCGKQTPTPYLRARYAKLLAPGLLMRDAIVADLGCGDGRNSKFLINALGIPMRLHAFDINDDYGTKLILGKEKLPINDGTVDIILAQYVLMFLTPVELKQMLGEMYRIASRDCRILIELYESQLSYTRDSQAIAALKSKILDYFLGGNIWRLMGATKTRFVLARY